MAERLRFDDTLKRAFQANLRWYEGLSRVTADYLQALTRVWTDACAGFLGHASASVVHAPPAAAAPPPVALVLEAEAGQIAQGVVMVENRLARRVSATVATSAFSSRAGEEIWPTIRVQPGTVTLEPGGRVLVHIAAVVDQRFDPGLRYRGEVTVPGLSDTPIPVVLQRRASEPVASPASAGQTGSDPEGAKNPRRRRASAKRRQNS